MNESELRSEAATHYSKGDSHLALNSLAQATRLHVWQQMQEGLRPHMVECVRLNPKSSLTREQRKTVDEWIEGRYPQQDQYARVRRYYVPKTPQQDRRVTQAYQQIIAHKPQGKQMPAKINF